MQTGLVSQDLDKNPIAHSRVADLGLDRGNFHFVARKVVSVLFYILYCGIFISSPPFIAD